MPKAPAPRQAQPGTSPEPTRKKRKILHDESKGCRVTKAGRMQCESYTTKGKRCLSFETTQGARVCSTHALELKTTDDQETAYTTAHGKKQCEGISTSSGKQCSYFEEKLGARFCKMHAFQDASQRLVRICYGHYGGSSYTYYRDRTTPCSSFVPFPESGPVLPPFCPQHAHQNKVVRLERCQWSDEHRIACVRYVSIEREQFFCDEHIVDANSPKYRQQPIATASDDVLLAVMNYLRPEERVAFALTSRASATLVKGWGERDSPVSWSSGVTLEPVIISEAPTAEKFTLAVVPNTTDWDVFVTRKHSIQSVPFFSTFSAASLAAISAEYRRRMQSRLALKCMTCTSRIGRDGKYSIGGDRLAMPLYKITNDDVYKALDKFRFLFESINPACCMVCSGDLDMWPIKHLCMHCQTRSKEMLVRWCLGCHGKMGALRIARVFWQAQKSLSATSSEITA